MREISGGRARNISYNILQLHRKAQILVILNGYLNKKNIKKTARLSRFLLRIWYAHLSPRLILKVRLPGLNHVT